MAAAQHPNGRAHTRGAAPPASSRKPPLDLVRAAPRRLSRQPIVVGGRQSRTGSCARREAITLSVETDSSPESETADLLEEAHPLQAGAPVQDDSPTFAELGVRPEIVAALAEAGITAPFPIQEMTLPLALAGDDVIGQARTGTGKTLGFGLPLLERVTASERASGAHGEPEPHGRPAGPRRGPDPRAVPPRSPTTC